MTDEQPQLTVLQGIRPKPRRRAQAFTVGEIIDSIDRSRGFTAAQRLRRRGREAEAIARAGGELAQAGFSALEFLQSVDHGGEQPDGEATA